jgi:hypothetical protein
MGNDGQFLMRPVLDRIGAHLRGLSAELEEGESNADWSASELAITVVRPLDAPLGRRTNDVRIQDDVERADVRPGSAVETAVESTRATVRMYRQGFGDCFLLSLRGDREGYKILVNCGVILGTPDAAAIMSTIANDYRREGGGRD